MSAAAPRTSGKRTGCAWRRDGKNIDKTFIQSKMLNSSKGPAVHSLRAQADKQAYSTEMRKTLENQENLTIKQEKSQSFSWKKAKLQECSFIQVQFITARQLYSVQERT